MGSAGDGCPSPIGAGVAVCAQRWWLRWSLSIYHKQRATGKPWAGYLAAEYHGGGVPCLQEHSKSVPGGARGKGESLGIVRLNFSCKPLRSFIISPSLWSGFKQGISASRRGGQRPSLSGRAGFFRCRLQPPRGQLKRLRVGQAEVEDKRMADILSICIGVGYFRRPELEKLGARQAEEDGREIRTNRPSEMPDTSVALTFENPRWTRQLLPKGCFTVHGNMERNITAADDAYNIDFLPLLSRWNASQPGPFMQSIAAVAQDPEPPAARGENMSSLEENHRPLSVLQTTVPVGDPGCPATIDVAVARDEDGAKVETVEIDIGGVPSPTAIDTAIDVDVAGDGDETKAETVANDGGVVPGLGRDPVEEDVMNGDSRSTRMVMVMAARTTLVAVSCLMLGSAVDPIDAYEIWIAAIVVGAFTNAVGEFESARAKHCDKLVGTPRCALPVSESLHGTKRCTSVDVLSLFKAALASLLASLVSGGLSLLPGAFVVKYPYYIRLAVVVPLASARLSMIGVVCARRDGTRKTTAALRVLAGGWLCMFLAYGSFQSLIPYLKS